MRIKDLRRLHGVISVGVLLKCMSLLLCCSSVFQMLTVLIHLS